MPVDEWVSARVRSVKNLEFERTEAFKPRTRWRKLRDRGSLLSSCTLCWCTSSGTKDLGISMSGLHALPPQGHRNKDSHVKHARIGNGGRKWWKMSRREGGSEDSGSGWTGTENGDPRWGNSNVLVHHVLRWRVDVRCCLEADVREQLYVHEGTGLMSRWMRDGCTRCGKH